MDLALQLNRRISNLVITLLLLLASGHCVQSIFYDNVSYISLEGYAAGTDHQPYQGRVGMIPVVRLAGRSTTLARIAAYINARERIEMGRAHEVCAEPMTAQKLACALVGFLCIIAAVAALSLYGWRRMRAMWWLSPSLVLAILYASLAARYLQALWFPYDLPHMFLFGAASICILTRRYWWLLLLFTLDVPFRETSIYLIPLCLSSFFPLDPRHRSWRRAFALAGAMLVIWLAIRVPIAHHYSHNVTEMGNRVRANLRNLATPLHWPQIASIIGFLLVPVWMGRRYLSPASRAFLWWSLPCFAVTAYYGLWIESRVAIEWTIPFAALAAEELIARTVSRTPVLSIVSAVPVVGAPDQYADRYAVSTE